MSPMGYVLGSRNRGSVRAAAMQAAKSTKAEDVRKELATFTYDSAVGPVTFDDHDQARLPMILIEIEDGQPAIKGAETADIDYPKN